MRSTCLLPFEARPVSLPREDIYQPRCPLRQQRRRIVRRRRSVVAALILLRIFGAEIRYKTVLDLAGPLNL
jgi:hypothetical protein